jgi:hypothetical protein
MNPWLDFDVHNNVADNGVIVRNDVPCPLGWIDTCDWLSAGTNVEPPWNRHDPSALTSIPLRQNIQNSNSE